jgi:hypothetical protein
MQSAAEVDEPIRAADQRSEHIGREGVHRESFRVTFGGRAAGRLKEDAGIVDNSVHPADLVHLTGEVSGLGCAAEVADDHSRRVRGEVAERRRPLASAGVEDNVMAFTDEDTGGGAAESVGGAGDEDAGHGMILPPVMCWYRSDKQGEQRDPRGNNEPAGESRPSGRDCRWDAGGGPGFGNGRPGPACCMWSGVDLRAHAEVQADRLKDGERRARRVDVGSG